MLKPGGRLSIFEPINSFSSPEPEGRFCGFDVGPVTDLAEKVKSAEQRLADVRPSSTSTNAISSRSPSAPASAASS